jgi:signal transduction histidine kinase
MAFEDERKFLHDLANPLSIAHGNLRIALRKMDGLGEKDPQVREVLERLNKAMEACEKMAKQVADRRQVLMEKQNQAAS